MKKTKRNTKIQVILIVVALILGSVFVINKIASGETYAAAPTCAAGTPFCEGTSIEKIITNATCTASGKKTITCSVCQTTIEQVIPATGHTNPGWVEVASTCTKKGYRYYYCSMCFQKIRGEELELADHKYTVVNNENGTHTVKCSVCGEEKETKSCTNFTTTTSPATCLAEGYNRSVCRVCGYTKTTTLPALGHEYGQDGKCTRCGVAKPTTPGGGDPNPDPGDGGDPNPNPGDGEDTKTELSGITIYKVNDKDMTNVKINTKASELIKTIQDANEGATVTIFNSNNEAVSEDETLATGMRIEVTIGDTKYDITIVVKGDINGDGKAELIDIIKMNKHRLNKSQLEGAYLQAADVNGDGKVNLFDIVKLNKFRLNKITEL